MSEEQSSPPAPLGDMVGRLMRRVIARSRAELGRAARTSRAQVEIRSAQRDLDHFWIRLGKSSYNLAETGEIDHPALRRAMRRIDDLEARIGHLRAGEDPAD